jgi:multiple sugar transport system substrate-binding protein
MKKLFLVGLAAAAAGCSSSNDGNNNTGGTGGGGAGGGGSGGTGGGGTGGGTTQAVELSFLQHDNPAYRQADGVAFEAYTKAHPTVTFKPTSVDYASLTSTLVADLKTDHLSTDIVRIPPSWVCSFAANLSDVPADVASLSEAQNTFFAAPLSGSTCGGALKGLPMEYNLEYGGVVVNLDRYHDKFPGQDPAWATWDKFIDDASMLSVVDGTGKPLTNGLDIDPGWPQPAKHIFFSMILQRGGKYFNAAGDQFNFATPEATASLTEMVRWVKDKKVMSTQLIPSKNTFVTTRLATGATGYGYNDVNKPLSTIGYVGTWGLTDVKGQIPKGLMTQYGFYTLPPMVAGSDHKFVQNSGWALAVPKTSKHQKEAWDFIKSLALSPEAMRLWSATTGALPALKVNGTPDAAKADPLLAKVQPLLEKGQWVGYIPAGAIETVEGAIVSNFFAAANGTKDVATALADMQKTANAALTANK